MKYNLKSLTEEVIGISRIAAKFIREEGATFDLNRIEHKSPIDLVSYVDKETEKMLVTSLSKLVPEAGFLTEEGTVSQATSGMKWIIDPLDGTTNFLHKLPPFSVSIALMDENEELLVGVVYEVIGNECFYAWKGGGSWRDGNPIKVSDIDSIGSSLIAFGFPYSLLGKQDQYFEIMKKFVEKSHGLRRLGSAAVDLAYVACGRFNAYFEFNLKPWDIAAGILLVKEAGGKVSDFNGGKDFLYGKELLASGNIHEPMLEILRPGWGY